MANTNNSAQNELLSLVRTLQADVARLQRSANQNTSAQDSPDEPAPILRDETQARYAKIRVSARKSAIMTTPWVSDGVLNQKLDKRFDPTAPRLTARQAAQGELYDLLHSLPPNEVTSFHDPSVQSEFLGAMGESRSNMAHRIRCERNDLVWREKVIFKDALRREKFAVRMLGLADGVYPANAPILYDDLTVPPVEEMLDKIFRNPLLIRVARAILFGLSSLDDSSPRVTCSVNARIWMVNRTTAGLIAFCAIVARFAVSEDFQFQETGVTTQIPYHENFQYYKSLIETNPHDQRIIDLIHLWDEELFHGSSNQANDTSFDALAAHLAESEEMETD